MKQQSSLGARSQNDNNPQKGSGGNFRRALEGRLGFSGAVDLGAGYTEYV